MAEEEEPVGEAGGDDAGGGDASSDKSGKKKLFIIIGLVLLVLVGGLAGAYFTGLLDPVLEMIIGKEVASGGGESGDEDSGSSVFYDLEELLVNLNTGGRKSSFLKIRVSLELERAEDIPRIENVMPRVIDNFQTYLRELRIDDLKGSAGMYRLREELLRRVSIAAAPARVKDVLFKEMLVQ